MVRALPCHGRGYGFEPRRSRHFLKGVKDVSRFAVFLFLLLVVAGCAAPSSSVDNTSPVSISPTLALNYIQVQTTSSLAGLTTEKNSLSDAVISGLNDTGLFQVVSTEVPTNSPVNGIKVSADIANIKKVSDDARVWTGSFAGQASVLVHVIVTDLTTGRTVETFDAEGKSGKSAWAGTTDAAIHLAASRIVAAVVKINSQTSQ